MSQSPQQLFDNEALTYDEVAERLRLSRRSLERLVAANKIPHRKLGRAVRFYWPQIVDWLARKKGA